jgi:hypothetical protein
MFQFSSFIRSVARAGACLSLFIVLSFAPGVSIDPVQAQQHTRSSGEFRAALKPYGSWHRSNRWGEVWRPAHVRDNWRPYFNGRWAYTNDYGWYWLANEDEADWSWVVYHYGRWVYDPDEGWAWVPGNQWAPAWVAWRRGHDHIGWAPLPPEELIVEYRDRPNVWLFVRGRDFTAPSIARVVLPYSRDQDYLRQTVIVNRTVVVNRPGVAFAVNPGIEPAVVATIVRRPIHAYNIRPRVLAGTARVPGAVEVRAQELARGGRPQVRVRAEQSTTVIRPGRNVPQPRPLAANENGRLGDNPPRAARQEARQPSERGQQRGERRVREEQRERPGAQGDVQEQGDVRGNGRESQRGEDQRGARRGATAGQRPERGEDRTGNAVDRERGTRDQRQTSGREQGAELRRRATEQQQDGTSARGREQNRTNVRENARRGETSGRGSVVQPSANEQQRPRGTRPSAGTAQQRHGASARGEPPNGGRAERSGSRGETRTRAEQPRATQQNVGAQRQQRSSEQRRGTGAQNPRAQSERSQSRPETRNGGSRQTEGRGAQRQRQAPQGRSRQQSERGSAGGQRGY